MKNKLYLFFLFFFLNNLGIGYSQSFSDSGSTSISTFNMFREPSYISAFGGIGNMEPLIFEADIVPYYMLSLNQNAKYGIELSPRIILRMYNKESYPVRTPSFMPKATFFYHIIEKGGNKRDLFAYLSWCHHSNGQDGNFYNSDSISINNLTGNFATNYMEGGVFFSRPDKKKPFVINYLKISYNYHYKQISELSNRYGKSRFFIDHQAAVNLSKVLKIFGNTNGNSAARNAILTHSLRAGWIGGDLNNTKSFNSNRLIVRYTLSFKPSFLNDVTFFAQYYFGQDYYNIYFNRTLKELRFGISAKTGVFN